MNSALLSAVSRRQFLGHIAAGAAASPSGALSFADVALPLSPAPASSLAASSPPPPMLEAVDPATGERVAIRAPRKWGEAAEEDERAALALEAEQEADGQPAERSQFLRSDAEWADDLDGHDDDLDDYVAAAARQ